MDMNEVNKENRKLEQVRKGGLPPLINEILLDDQRG